jgi:hypothetical protein
VVLVGFYFIARGPWARLPACLIGFVIARLIATRLTRVTAEPAHWAPEAGHAP